MIKVNQIRFSESVKKFKEPMIDKYGLKPYKYDDLPVIFFGLYRIEDYLELVSHKSKSIIIWRGSDSLNIKKYEKYIPKIKKSKNIAISQFISDDLSKYEISHKKIPITSTKNIKNLKPRGENIYFYGDLENKMYGGDIIKRIIDKIPYNVIFTKSNTYKKEELEKIYESCFIGLRLTKHDGLPNTVCEMGLMGRKCLYNGNTPNAIPYTSDKDIITLINKEYKNRNLDNSEIVDNMYDFLNIDDSWLYID